MITLILTDDERVRPDLRVDKSFPIKQVNDQYLADRASDEIAVQIELQDAEPPEDNSNEKLLAGAGDLIQKILDLVEKGDIKLDKDLTESLKEIDKKIDSKPELDKPTDSVGEIAVP